MRIPWETVGISMTSYTRRKVWVFDGRPARKTLLAKPTDVWTDAAGWVVHLF